MKIAIFSETYTPQTNGVVTSTKTFKTEFEKMGHSVVVMCPKTEEKERSTDDIWRFRSIAFPFQPEYRMATPLSRKLKKFKDMKFDVIHVQTPFFMGHLGQYLSKKHNIPMVHTYHTFWAKYLHYFPLLPKKFRRPVDLLLLSKNFCDRCDHVVIPSVQMKEVLMEYGVSTPLDVIPTGIDLDNAIKKRNTTSFRKQWHLSPTDKVCIFVGRLGQEKNIYFLLDAFKKVKNEIPNAKLIVVGDGPERKKMGRKAAQHGIGDHVIFTGYLNHDDVFTAYAASDLILFPSKTETQGLSLVEGMAQGKPAVCIGEMGVKDILVDQRGGFLVKDDIDEFSQKAILLLSDKDLYEEKARQAAARGNDYSSTNMAKKMLNIYKKAIKSREENA